MTGQGSRHAARPSRRLDQREYEGWWTEPYADGVTSSALLTDHYELTMLQAALAGGTADRRAVFELFPRRLPSGRR